jgi:electron transport complex protein RnfC
MSPPTTLKPPAKVLIPLRQHRGEGCQAAVEPGQTVLMGQVVGSCAKGGAAPVHASVSGKVTGLVETHDPAGGKVQAVVIENDGRDAWAEPGQGALAPVADAAELDQAPPEKLLEAICSLGLVRAAQTALPLHLELAPTEAAAKASVDTLIISAVDVDPPVAPNQSLLLKDPDPELELGISALARILKDPRVLLVLPEGQAGAGLEGLARNRKWETRRIKADRFPYAMDNLIIHSLTGRVVPTPQGLPGDVGVAIMPLLTALEAGQALKSGRPMVERVFSVCGDVKNPQTFRVRLGTPLSQVIEAAGGFNGEPGKVVLNGPMMGLAQFDLEAPVSKETYGVFVQAAQHVAAFKNHPCIHCGRCLKACPVYLIPAELSKFCEYGAFEQAAEKDLFHCIECGCCAYVCPAKRPMVQLLQFGKSEVLAKRMES